MKLNRKNKLLIGLGTTALILISKLFVIQIIDDKYKLDADNNSMVYSIIYPTRGIIHDRNGRILVGNKVAYDLLVTPREVEAFDTLGLAKVLDVDPDVIREKMAEYRKYRRRIGWQTVVMMKQIPQETYMKFAEVAYRFPGFRGQARSIREYPYNAGGNLLGYVSEVDANYLKRHPEEYKAGDYAGMTGIEAAREKELRGEKGYTIWLRNGQGSHSRKGYHHHYRCRTAALRTAADAEQSRQSRGDRTIHRRDPDHGIQPRNRRRHACKHRPALWRNIFESI